MGKWKSRMPLLHPSLSLDQQIQAKSLHLTPEPFLRDMYKFSIYSLPNSSHLVWYFKTPLFFNFISSQPQPLLNLCQWPWNLGQFKGHSSPIISSQSHHTFILARFTRTVEVTKLWDNPKFRNYDPITTTRVHTQLNYKRKPQVDQAVVVKTGRTSSARTIVHAWKMLTLAAAWIPASIEVRHILAPVVANRSS